MTVQIQNVMINTMNLMRSNRSTRLIFIAVALFTFLSATACGGKAKKADRAPSERRVLQTEAPPPSTEVLKDSPCGNPDWAKPPGSAGEEAVDAEFRTTSRKKSAAKKTKSKSDQPAEQPQAHDPVEDTPKETDESDD